MGISLVPGDKLCSLCRTHLQKLSFQVLEELPTLVDLPIPGPSISYLNEQLPLSASTESTSDDSVVHGVDMEEVIHYLQLTPCSVVTLNYSVLTAPSREHRGIIAMFHNQLTP